jgi:hypothetical protein
LRLVVFSKTKGLVGKNKQKKEKEKLAGGMRSRTQTPTTSLFSLCPPRDEDAKKNGQTKKRARGKKRRGGKKGSKKEKSLSPLFLREREEKKKRTEKKKGRTKEEGFVERG